MMSKLTPFQEHIFKKLHKTEYKLLLKQLDQDITRAFSTKNKLKAILDNELLELNEQMTQPPKVVPGIMYIKEV